LPYYVLILKIIQKSRKIFICYYPILYNL